MKILLTGIMITGLAMAAKSQALLKINGRVSDTDNRPVKNATIHFLNSTIVLLSDSLGSFITSVPAGNYAIDVNAAGFATYHKTFAVNSDVDLTVSLQPSSQQLDAVVVTAQKREENLQAVPLSISAFSARKVQEYRIWSTQQIRGIVPNLFSSNPGDNRNVTSIRGITTTSYDPAIATYIDGVNQFNLDTYISDLLDIERIEILRGPQGTLYGRNAMGGVINIITKQPSNKTNGFAEASIGNYALQRYTAGVRTPIIKDKLFAGIAAMYQSRDGYFTNTFDNSSFDKQHNFSGNYFLKYVPISNWNVTLNVKHSSNRNNGAFTLINGVEEALAHPFEVNQNARTTMVDNVLNGSFSVQHNGKNLNFTSQTAYQSNHRYYRDPIDGDFSPIDGVTIINNYGSDWNKVKVFTQEFKFSNPSTSTNPFAWTAGVYLFSQHNPVKQATRFGEDAELLGSTEKNFSLINTSTGKSNGAAAFGQVEYYFTDRLSLIGGIRFDYERKKLSVLGEYQMDPDPNPIFETQPDTSATATFNAWSPKLGLSYNLSPNSKTYLLYSKGYRAGGLTSLGSDPSQPPLYPYNPEYSSNFEIGLKNNFINNKLRLNLTAFYITVDDAQVPTLVLPDAITVTRNAGKLESKGVELELASALLNGLELEYNFGYTAAEYKTLKVPMNGAEVNLQGKKQLFTPDITSSFAAQYSLMLSERSFSRIVLRGEWLYFGKQYFDLANQIAQPAYHILNARVGFASKRFDVMLWGRNLGDRQYIDFAYDFGAVHLADPRTVGITLSARL